MITVTNLTRKINNKVILNDVSFSLEDGEILGIIGPNGAGKSTLLSILAGVQTKYDGKVEFSNREATGYVPQEIALFDELTIIDNLKFFGYGKIKDTVLLNSRIEEIIKILDLSGFLNEKIKKLSGGTKRKVNMAVGVLSNPQYLIMDEPLTGVDLIVRRSIEEFLIGLKNEGKTLIIASHLIDFLEKISDKIMIIENGKVKYFGKSHEVDYENFLFNKI